MNKLKNLSLEVLANIFTIDNGKIRILLLKKKTEPYKGYWMLPNKILEDETIEENIKKILMEQIGTDNVYLKQDYTFSEINRIPNSRVIATSYIGIVDSTTAKIKQEKTVNVELDWFSLDEIPKMAYDHKSIIDNSISTLKKQLVNTKILKQLFPSDFTISEIQYIYEFILNKKLDRRNFQKKIINLDLIEDTGYKYDNGNGRPAKLYKFKENIKEINLF